jgi:O-antigen/teichoic acid export membrane protein
MARGRTFKVLISGLLFMLVAFVAGFVFAYFTDSWVWAVVAGLVVAAAVEWVYAAVVWRPGRRRSPPEG